MKEFLSARAVDFVSVNVAADPEALQRIRNAGFRSLPVVERGDALIHGVDLARVATLIGTSYDATPVLSPVDLVDRYLTVLDAAMRFAGQIPEHRLQDKLPHRNRSYLTLVNHLVQIGVDYLAVAAGADFVDELAASLPKTNASVPELVRRANDVKKRLLAWIQGVGLAELSATVTTYFGDQSMHAVLERAVWHSAQHTRQLMMVLDGLGLVPDGPLTSADLDQLPMPANVWDG